MSAGYENNMNKFIPEQINRPDLDRRANWAETNPEAESFVRNKGGVADLDDLGLSVVNGTLCVTYTE